MFQYILALFLLLWALILITNDTEKVTIYYNVIK